MHLPSLLTSALAVFLLASSATAADPASIPTETQVNTVCPISGKPANPAITVVYEGRTFAFHEEACRAKFNEARAKSLYQRLGGQAAIDAAVEAFYVKVLADKRVNHYFEDINMNKQKRKQKEILSAALGGPIPWTGKDMRKAHADLPGLTDVHFNAIAENLKSTLEDLKVDKALIDEVIALVGTLRGEVLNRPASPAATL